MSRVLYFDCFSGAAGDMVLGALLDAGLPLGALRDALGSLGVGHELRVTRVLRAGLSASYVEVVGEDDAAHSHAHTHDQGEPHGHGHDHGHPHDHTPSHVHRSLHDINHLIGHSALSKDAKARARAMFRRLAEAEAAIHQMPVEQVHLHEVGAIDSVIDICGVAFGLEWFGIEDIVCSPLNVGGGRVTIAHGSFPVPAPATLTLLRGVPVYSGEIQSELVTPTGALVMSTYAKAFGPMPAMSVERIGYGAGTKDFPNSPNVLRVVIGERTRNQNLRTSEPQNPRTAVLEIACDLDDMSPQLFGPVSDALFAAGALEVFLAPIYMKKGRPGTLLTVLCEPDRREAICTLVFRETTTLGVRINEVEREVLAREWVEVVIDGGPVRIKIGRRRGEIVNAAPEFEDCVRIAKVTGQPIKNVQAAAMKAWADVREPL